MLLTDYQPYGTIWSLWQNKTVIAVSVLLYGWDTDSEETIREKPRWRPHEDSSCSFKQFNLVSLFNGKSGFVGYLMPMPSL